MNGELQLLLLDAFSVLEKPTSKKREKGETFFTSLFLAVYVLVEPHIMFDVLDVCVVLVGV